MTLMNDPASTQQTMLAMQWFATPALALSRRDTTCMPLPHPLLLVRFWCAAHVTAPAGLLRLLERQRKHTAKM
jgi:hypothetical protein